MYLQKINIINFKNIKSSSIAFCNKINCFIGDNAAGKSNYLDSIYYMSMCKSGFGVSDKKLINRGGDFFVVEGEYISNLEVRDIVNCSYKSSGVKKIKRNDKEYQRLAEHIGNFPLVMISPYDNEIINESGEERRKYLNMLISQIDRRYLNNLIKYNQLLSHRNSLLKNMRLQGSRDVMEVVDMQISEVADNIYQRRVEVVELLTPIIKKYYAILCRDSEEIEIKYSSKLEIASMEELLKENFQRDIINQFTSVGIHRDDLKMSIDDYPVRRFGSQGQQKSFIIALKLAQYEIMYNNTNEKPILLLDDVFDKLDANRVEGLINIVNSEDFGQIFINDCDRQRLKNIVTKISTNYTIYNITNGDAELCSEERHYL